jgi:hypothetical protein
MRASVITVCLRITGSSTLEITASLVESIDDSGTVHPTAIPDDLAAARGGRGFWRSVGQ